MSSIFTPLLALVLACTAGAATISNSKLSATVTANAGLTAVGNNVVVKNDSFALTLSSSTFTSLVITPTACSSAPALAVQSSSNVTLTYTGCPNGVTVVARYWLQTATSNYVSKDLTVTVNTKPYTVESVSLYGPAILFSHGSASADATPSVITRINPFNPSAGQLAAFVRFNDAEGSGMFVSVTNPFTALADAGSSGGGGSSCVQGVNFKNNDLPGSPYHYANPGACEAACKANANCVGYVWNAPGCEGTPPPGNCFLKSKLISKVNEPCACTGTKPFPAPPGPSPAPAMQYAGVSATYSAGDAMTEKSPEGYYTTDEGVIGLTTLGKYTVGTDDSLYKGEHKAFITCVEEHYLDTASRANQTVKVNVAWDESDYQIDVGTTAGQTEYHRIIDRNADFGSTHIVYEPANSLRGSRFNTTDGWGWEGSLWFSMGEQVREGTWDPLTDPVPPEILAMVAYAESKGVKLLSYCYPTLPFVPLKDYWVAGKSAYTVDISRPEVQDWYISRMLAFMEKTGAGGWAWDHDIFAGPRSSRYGQWRGWMRILNTLRAAHPNMVMDHRQTAHAWGPWYQLAGSYDEPIAGDENPETYGVPIASLHTDHVAADNTRIINYKYSVKQLIPPSRVPGFIFHQTERTADNGTNPCFSSSKLCYDSNVRDFDLMGYKYSLLSTVGTAGQNNVLTMIPARDVEEFKLFPAADLKFIKDWLAWTDTNIRFLRNTAWIAQLGSPAVGSVDGTASMDGDEGYIFLFNPGFVPLVANFTVDEAIGISNASASASWTVSELYPSPTEFTVDTWKHGSTVSVSVGGSDCRVLKLTKLTKSSAAPSLPPMLVGSVGTVVASVGQDAGTAVVTGASAPTGSSAVLRVVVAGGSRGLGAAAANLVVNGKSCTSTTRNDAGDLAVTATFAGAPIHHAMPISPGAVPQQPWKGGWLNTSFVVPSAMKAQAAARQAAYPIDWGPADYKASWLVPSRLLVYAFIVQPTNNMKLTLMVDGAPVDVTAAYNSRGLPHPRTFLGFYFDASKLSADTPHKLSISVPPSDFQGLFWENVDTEYTSEVIKC